MSNPKPLPPNLHKQRGMLTEVAESQVHAIMAYQNKHPSASQQEVAKATGIDYKRISALKPRIANYYRALAKGERDIFVGRALSKLNAVERAAWEGWERSLRDGKKHKVGVSGDKGVDIVEVQEQAGDPAFLAQVRGCIADTRQLLGLDAPTKFEIEARIRDGVTERIAEAALQILGNHCPAEKLLEFAAALEQIAATADPNAPPPIDVESLPIHRDPDAAEAGTEGTDDEGDEPDAPEEKPSAAPQSPVDFPPDSVGDSGL